MLDIFNESTQMEHQIAGRDWAQLEETYRILCTAHAGDGQASRITAVDLSGFTQQLRNQFIQAVARAKQSETKAIYYEYDMDNDWHSVFFLCTDYTPRIEEDDDWASDWEETVDGPDSPELSSLYRENGFNDTDIATGSTLYLIARTVAALGRCVDDLQARGDLDNMPVCIGFHDQYIVYRLLEKRLE